MKMTIRKIAELAGTSRSAVDKVIHDRPGVSEAVRQEVLRVIEQTGYVPLHERRTAGAPNPRVHTVAVFSAAAEQSVLSGAQARYGQHGRGDTGAASGVPLF